MAREKFYNMHVKATDKNGQDHWITVVGRFRQIRKIATVPSEMVVVDTKGKSHNATLLTEVKQIEREFTLAKSICDPRDTFNEAHGVELATKRLDTNPIGTITSQDITMLNPDQCQMLVFTELKHVAENINSYAHVE